MRIASLFLLLFALPFPGFLRADDAAVAETLRALGGEVTLTEGTATKVVFRDCSKLGDAEFRGIGQLHGLKVLTLYGQCHGLTDATLPHLAGLTALEELGTDGIRVSDAGLKALTALVSLKSAAFFHTSFGLPGFDGTGFGALRALPKLERLTLAGISMGDAGFAALAEIGQLRDFSTWHTYQTAEGNQSIARFKNLRSLRLGQRLPRHVDGAPAPPSLTDASLRDFLGLGNLETLTLMEGRFTPEALAALQALPKLKKLNLQVAPLTPEQLDRVKAALPGVAVEWKPLTDEEAKKLELYLKP